MAVAKKILAIVSVLLFLLCAFGVTFSHVALLPLGLAVYASIKLLES